MKKLLTFMAFALAAFAVQADQQRYIPSLRVDNLTWNPLTTDDDDCTGDLGKSWYDSVDLRYEFCLSNSGVPVVLYSTFSESTRFAGTSPNAKMEAAITACGAANCGIAIPASEGDGALDLRNVTTDLARIMDTRQQGNLNIDGSWFGSSLYHWKGVGLYFRHTPVGDSNSHLYTGLQVGLERVGGAQKTFPVKDDDVVLSVMGQDRGGGQFWGLHAEVGKYGAGDGAAVAGDAENYGAARVAGDEGLLAGRFAATSDERGVVSGTVSAWASPNLTVPLVRGAQIGAGRFVIKTNSGTYTTGTVALSASSITVTGTGTDWTGTGKPCSTEGGPCPASGSWTLDQTPWCLVVTDDVNDCSCNPWIGGSCGAAACSPTIKGVFPVKKITNDTSLDLETTVQGLEKNYWGYGTSGEAYTLYPCARIEAVDYADEATSQSPTTTLQLDAGYTGWVASDTVEIQPDTASFNTSVTLRIEDKVLHWTLPKGLYINNITSQGGRRAYAGMYLQGNYIRGLLLDGDFSTAAIQSYSGDTLLQGGGRTRWFSDAGVTETAHVYGTTGDAVFVGSVTADEYIYSTGAGLNASTTQTQGSGQLNLTINDIAVVANANDTVTLPGAAAGIHILIINNGANTLQIFPASADNLGAGTDTATTITTSQMLECWAYSTSQWRCVKHTKV